VDNGMIVPHSVTMKKLLLFSLVAVLFIAQSNSLFATPSTSSYVGIFGTNSSQTNFTVPAGDSVYIARLFRQNPNEGYNGYDITATFLNITNQVSNSIVFTNGKNKVITTTKLITNYFNLTLFSPSDFICNEGVLVQGPAYISTTGAVFQYKYFPKKSPYQILTAPIGTTNPISITIPAGQKLHKCLSAHDSSHDAPMIAYLNGFFLENDIGDNEIYGPSTLSFLPSNVYGTPSNFYFSYIIINSDTTSFPITTP
jgi:hypothetical protein